MFCLWCWGVAGVVLFSGTSSQLAGETREAEAEQLYPPARGVKSCRVARISIEIGIGVETGITIATGERGVDR